MGEGCKGQGLLPRDPQRGWGPLNGRCESRSSRTDPCVVLEKTWDSQRTVVQGMGGIARRNPVVTTGHPISWRGGVLEPNGMRLRLSCDSQEETLSGTILVIEETPHTISLRNLPSPEPALGWAAYYEERERALAASPRCRDNFERYQKSLRRSVEVDYLPIVLDIENVSRCNFRCIMCQVRGFEKGKRARDMTLAEFKQLIDDQYGLVEIKLHGMGEPTMQGKDFFEMIRYARARHIWVRTVTNASLLHVRDNYRTLVDTGINEIQISVDGADPTVYEAIRVHGEFSRMKENCLLINRYCQERKLPLTKMWTMVQRDNVHQLEALVDLAAELEFPSIVFSVQIVAWGAEHVAQQNREINVAQSLNVDRLRGLVVRGEKRGVRVRFWSALQKYSQDRPENTCPWPFERAYIGSDGRTVPCCMIGNPDTFEIGKGLSFAQAWASKEYADFRRAHLSGEVPEVCKSCYLASAHTGRAAAPEAGVPGLVKIGSSS